MHWKYGRSLKNKMMSRSTGCDFMGCFDMFSIFGPYITIVGAGNFLRGVKSCGGWFFMVFPNSDGIEVV